MIRLKKTIHQIIAEEIPENSTVLDLGCGNGDLLNYLINNKNVKGHGLDINSNAIINCIEKGIPVIQIDLNNLPLDFAGKAFDVVILNQTIQEVLHPDKIILEMLRIGKTAILGFPNFGTINIRFGFLLKGKMPVTQELPYSWYDTPNIHLLTIKDFKDYCQKNTIKIEKEIYLAKSKKNRNSIDYKKIKLLPNIRAELAVFKIFKK
ncbi:MAG: methionine biosynthesis protein MetW [Spirochaetes bacterium]|nr:methionine biosynthesis protein MetW [Spirochaetota bacterium]